MGIRSDDNLSSMRSYPETAFNHLYDVVDINDASYNDILNIVSDSYIIDTSNIHHIETTIDVSSSILGTSILVVCAVCVWFCMFVCT